MLRIFFVCFILMIANGCNKSPKHPSPLTKYKLKESNTFASQVVEVKIKSTESGEVSVSKINDPLLKKGVIFSEIANEIKLIKLETNNDVQIGHIDKIVFDDQGIFVLDSRKARALFWFSNEGKFKLKFGKVGKGPGEYIIPRDFCVDRKNNQISIFDDRTLKVNIYSISSGRFVRAFRLGFYPSNLAKIGPYYVFNLNYNSNLHSDKIKNHMLLYTDIKGKVIKKAVKYSPNESDYLSHFRVQSCFYNYDSITYFRPFCSDTIYKITDSIIYTKYLINNPSRIPRKYYENVSAEAFNEKYVNYNSKFEFVIPYSYMYETSNWLLMSEIYKGQRIFYLQNKKEITKKYLFNRIDDQPRYLGNCFNPITSYKDYIISVIEPEILTNTENLKLINMNLLLNNDREIIKATKDLDNPILMLIKLR